VSEREHDLVVHGATGFVGRLLAADLAVHAPQHLRIALAGRSATRLEDLRATLPGPARDWPLVVADSSDDAGLERLARSTRVVATTVGPYARHGFGLARACAEAGTHYADLTGEVLFVRELVDRLHGQAQESGARLVTACGFDSVPSDLGVLLLHERAAADGAGDLGDTTLLVRQLRGGVSGGTVDSMRTMVAAATSDAAARRVVLDPYALSPDRQAEPQLGRQSDVSGVMRDGETGQWTAPFVMGSFNTRIVRRSSALAAHAYGRRFRYRELMACGRGRTGQLRAAAVSAGLGALVVGMANPLTRPLLGLLLPSPGEGPSEEVRRRGSFRMEVRTATSSGRRYLAVVAAQADPGYAGTAVMLAESALCLAEDEPRLPAGAGVLTPATAFGDVLVERLRARGFTLTVEELTGPPTARPRHTG
jgi:short subunit dehydrogenase-like uncharacterized protein